MANQQSLWESTFVAENDLRTKQYYLVEISGNDKQVDVCDGAGDKVLGPLLNKPNAGQAAVIGLLGVHPVVSDGNAGAIVAGDWLGTDANGKAVKKSANNDIVIGRALDPSTADGTIIRVLITGAFYFGA